MPNDHDALDEVYSCHRLSGGRIAMIWSAYTKDGERIVIGWQFRHDKLVGPRDARLAFMDEPTEIACHAILTTIHSEGEP